MNPKEKAIIHGVTNVLPILRNFPTVKGQVQTIMDLIDKLTKDAEQVERLMKEMVECYNDWPGPKELRDTSIYLFQPYRVVMGDPESK